LLQGLFDERIVTRRPAAVHSSSPSPESGAWQPRSRSAGPHSLSAAETRVRARPRAAGRRCAARPRRSSGR
jgi:hypothetical protein